MLGKCETPWCVPEIKVSGCRYSLYSSNMHRREYVILHALRRRIPYEQGEDSVLIRKAENKVYIHGAIISNAQKEQISPHCA